jgi:hypothetical protein
MFRANRSQGWGGLLVSPRWSAAEALCIPLNSRANPTSSFSRFVGACRIFNWGPLYELGSEATSETGHTNRTRFGGKRDSCAGAHNDAMSPCGRLLSPHLSAGEEYILSRFARASLLHTLHSSSHTIIDSRL